MRLALAAIGLLLLGACTTPVQTANVTNAHSQSDLQRFVTPTDGAAYSQGDPRYYLSGNWVGGGGAVPRPMH